MLAGTGDFSFSALKAGRGFCDLGELGRLGLGWRNYSEEKSGEPMIPVGCFGVPKYSVNCGSRAKLRSGGGSWYDKDTLCVRGEYLQESYGGSSSKGEVGAPRKHWS